MGRFLLGPLLLGLSLASVAGPAEDDERILSRLVNLRGVQRGDVQILRQKGMAWLDVAYVIVVSGRVHSPIWTVGWLKESGLTWAEICVRFGLDPREVEQQARELLQTAGGAV
jgi:hypothetical protein